MKRDKRKERKGASE